MKGLIILALCFLLYVMAVELYEARTAVMHQGEMARQEQSFNYVPPSPPLSENGSTLLIQGL